MNEITRIHLAKTPYNIETAAYAVLNDYLNAIEKALHADADAMREIESRMSEILAERGIAGETVITNADVEALQKQLGDPKDFAGEDYEEKTSATVPQKRLMRDTSNAMLGGVCSGIAAYFGWDVVMVRVAAVILALISSGVAIPVYIVMWIIMPVAKSAADRLMMTGAPVTLGSLKDTASSGDNQPKKGEPLLVKLLRGVLGVGLIAGAVVSAITVAVAAAYIAVRPEVLDFFGSRLEMGVSVGLMALGGVMLATFCGILAYMVFRKTAERNLIIALVLATIVGLGSFGAGIAMPITRQVTMEGKLATTNTTKHLGVDLSGVTSIKADSSNLEIHYTVSDSRREASLRYNDLMVKRPNVSFARQGSALIINGTFTKGAACDTPFNFCDDRPLELYITGPSLESIVAAGSEMTYEATSQETLSVEHDDGYVGLSSRGRINTVSVKSAGGSFSSADATIGTVNLEASRSSSTLASVDTLNITAQTDSCSAPVMVSANHAGTVLVNGQSWGSSVNYPCLALSFADRSDD